ncbi:MAG: vWA domain-containing protein [Streptosporangiaceae bacterium]
MADVTYRYGQYRDGPDPLAPPYDARVALDELGDAVLAGSDPAAALRDLIRRGMRGQRGLDDMLRRVRERQREVRDRGRLDGILEQARALLDTAIGQERAELFPDPGDDARMREEELDSLPSDTAQAIRRLAGYDWRSAAARETFEQLKDLLRRQVLDSQFRGMKDALESPDPEAMQRVKDMLAELNQMLEADARGEHTQQDFEAFMDRYGDMFPDRPANLEELVDALVRRAMAAQRLLSSLSPDQRDELAALMQQTLADEGLAAEMARLADALRARRPELDADGWPGETMTGGSPLDLGDATTALADLADLAELETALRQDYPGARLDDIDEAAVRRALGRAAVDDMEALRQTERELERQGYLQRSAGKLELTPKAVRRLGETALRRVFAELPEGGYGDHEQRDAGQAGEYTGATRPWQFGDEQSIDAPATVRNALLRDATAFGSRAVQDPRHREGDPPRVRLSAEDFEVGETERRASAAVCLLVDLSYSMAIRGTWGAAKQTALALHALVRSRFPQDSIQVIGFSNYARELRETDLAGLGWDMVQGTNLHHALVLAGRYLDRRPEHDPVVLIVTDGEPTAHLRRDGQSVFDWPPAPETLELTLAEVDKMTRRRASLNIFMLVDDERLSAFVDEVARRNGGRVLHAQPERLGEYVVKDFLRTRRASKR